MSPDVSRQLGRILGRHVVRPDERDRIIGAARDAEVWEDIPADIRALLDEIDRR